MPNSANGTKSIGSNNESRKSGEKAGNSGGAGAKDGGRGGNAGGSKDTKTSNTKSANTKSTESRDHQDHAAPAKASPKGGESRDHQDKVDTRGSAKSGATQGSQAGKVTKAGDRVSDVHTKSVAEDASLAGRAQAAKPKAGEKVTDVFGQPVAQDPAIAGRLQKSLGELIAKTRGLDVKPADAIKYPAGAFNDNAAQLAFGGYPVSSDPFAKLANLVKSPVPAGEKVTDVAMDPSIKGIMANMFNNRPPDVSMTEDGRIVPYKDQSRLTPPSMDMQQALFGETGPTIPHDMLSMRDPLGTLGIPQADPTTGQLYHGQPKMITDRLPGGPDIQANAGAAVRAGLGAAAGARPLVDAADAGDDASRNIHINPAGNDEPPAQTSSVATPPRQINDRSMDWADINNANSLGPPAEAKQSIIGGLMSKIFSSGSSNTPLSTLRPGTGGSGQGFGNTHDVATPATPAPTPATPATSSSNSTDLDAQLKALLAALIPQEPKVRLLSR